MTTRIHRRQLLKAAAISPLVAAVNWPRPCAANARDPLPVAAVVTVYRENSHADVIVGKILEGYDQQGGPGPDLKLVSLYVDQFPETDLSRELAAKHGFRVAETIDDAITLGTNDVQVAGVLSIGEHGSYPLTADTNQRMYPRLRFFNEIVTAFRRCGRSVPVFNDKHLSYCWGDAQFMCDTARRMDFPLMAGSSLPVAWRIPPLELPLDCEIEAALGIGYGGLEDYGFHALETLQCMVERRRGGETGVTSVQIAKGDAIWEAQRKGRWSRDLLDAALEVIPHETDGPPDELLGDAAAFFLVESRDGMRSAVAMANGLLEEFGCAVKLKGEAKPLASWFKLQNGKPYGHFSYLLRAIEQMIHVGQAAYPAERTLLTTGILDRAMRSSAQNGAFQATPELDVQYTAVDWPYANHPESPLTLPND